MNFFSNRDGGMEKQLFDLKFTSKQLEKLASKSTKQEREELLKVKKALQKGDMDIARIHGQNAIRNRNTGNNYLRLASRMDAVASRVESAVKMKQVTKQMSGVVKSMDKASTPHPRPAEPARIHACFSRRVPVLARRAPLRCSRRWIWRRLQL